MSGDKKPRKWSPFLVTLKTAREGKGRVTARTKEESWRWEQQMKEKYGKNCLRTAANDEKRIRELQGKGFEVCQEAEAGRNGNILMIWPDKEANDQRINERNMKIKEVSRAQEGRQDHEDDGYRGNLDVTKRKKG